MGCFSVLKSLNCRTIKIVTRLLPFEKKYLCFDVTMANNEIFGV